MSVIFKITILLYYYKAFEYFYFLKKYSLDANIFYILCSYYLLCFFSYLNKKYNNL